jgi:hypothetical protein
VAGRRAHAVGDVGGDRRRKPGLARRLAQSAQPLARAVLACRCGADERPPASAARGEEAAGLAAGGDVREAHDHVDRACGQVPDLDHRHLVPREQPPGRLGVHHAGEHQRVDPPSEEAAHQRRLDLRVVAAVADHQLVALRAQHRGQPVHRARVDRVHQRGHDDGDDAAAAGRQRARRAVGQIAELGHRVADRLQRGSGDLLRMPQRARHRHRGDAGQARDLGEPDRPARGRVRRNGPDPLCGAA